MVRTFQGQESPDPGIPCVLISDDAGRRVHAALDQGPKKNMLRHDPIDVISLSDGGLIKATKTKWVCSSNTPIMLDLNGIGSLQKYEL